MDYFKGKLINRHCNEAFKTFSFIESTYLLLGGGIVLLGDQAIVFTNPCNIWVSNPFLLILLMCADKYVFLKYSVIQDYVAFLWDACKIVMCQRHGRKLNHSRGCQFVPLSLDNLSDTAAFFSPSFAVMVQNLHSSYDIFPQHLKPFNWVQDPNKHLIVASDAHLHASYESQVHDHSVCFALM